MQHIWQDVRHAIRALRKAPGMSVISIVTLAVGIAAVSTIFSFVNSVFYRPLPYPDADRIVAITSIAPKGYYDWSANPLDVVEQRRRQARSFERVAAYHEETGRILTLTGARDRRGDRARRVAGAARDPGGDLAVRPALVRGDAGVLRGGGTARVLDPLAEGGARGADGRVAGE